MLVQDFYQRFKDYEPKLQESRGNYAVLVPLVEIDGASYLLYEIRSRKLRTQPGQVCFPGGRIEDGEDAVSCTLRETWEELGIPKTAIHIIAPLDFLSLRSASTMHPILAQIDADAIDKIILNPDEVERCELISLDALKAHPPRFYHYSVQVIAEDDFPYDVIQSDKEHAWLPGNGTVPVYEHLSIPLWGLTAKITHHLLQMMATD